MNEQKNSQYRGKDFTVTGQATYRGKTGIKGIEKPGEGVAQMEHVDPAMEFT